MMFKRVVDALQLYVEMKLSESESIPSIFTEVDKFRVVHSSQWICSNCFNITDTHTGECEQCGGSLVVYRATWSTNQKSEVLVSDKLGRIDFLVDFEKMLNKLTVEERKLLIYYGYSDLQSVIRYLLFKHDVRNTCENIDYAVRKIREAESKLQQIMIEKEYMSPNEIADTGGSGSDSEAPEKEHVRASQKAEHYRILFGKRKGQGISCSV